MRFLSFLALLEEGVERPAESAPGNVEVGNDSHARVAVLFLQRDDLLVVFVPVELRMSVPAFDVHILAVESYRFWKKGERQSQSEGEHTTSYLTRAISRRLRLCVAFTTSGSRCSLSNTEISSKVILCRAARGPV